MDHQIFSDKNIELKRIVLRNGGNDWNHSILLDGLFTKLIEGDIDIDYQAYRPSVVYINGSYWGIHNIREKIDEYYVESNFGIDKDDIDMLENDPYSNNISVVKGSKNDFIELINYISNNNIVQEVHYNYVKSNIDINQYINYQICEIFFSNSDWPMNNQKYWKSTDLDGKWRWILYDLEYMIVKKNLEFDMLSHAIDQDSNFFDFRFLFRELLKNENFKSTFLQRFSYFLNTIFHPLRTEQILYDISATLEDQIALHVNKWKNECFEREHWNPSQRIYCGIQSIDDWENELNFINEFLRSRNNHIKANILNYFEISDTCLVSIGTNINDAGSVYISGVDLGLLPYDGNFFQDIPLFLKINENPGYQFLGWEGINNELIESDSISLSLSGDVNLNAIFEPLTVSLNENSFPDKFILYQNWPNPFNSFTKINFSLPTDKYIKISIYNLKGDKLLSLIDAKLSKGNHSTTWDAKNYASGVYIIRAESDNIYKIMKTLLIK